MGGAFFRCRLFLSPRILIAAFESTSEIIDRMRLVAVLHLASGAPFKVDAASSLCFTLAFCPQARRANKLSCEKVEPAVRCSKYRGDIILRVAQFFLF